MNVQNGGILVVDVAVRYRAQELAGLEPVYAELVQAGLFELVDVFHNLVELCTLGEHLGMSLRR